jgi:hypothetical protein
MKESRRQQLLQFADLLQRDLPEGPITGNISQVPHRQVEYIASIIDRSGLPEQVDAWYWEDHGGQKPGGAPRIVSTRAALVLYLLMSVEHAPQLVDDMAKLVAHRLSNRSKQFLGLWGHPNRKRNKHWYWPLYHATTRILDPIDPKPAKGKRRKFPTLQEIEETQARREKDGTSAKQVRLDWFVNRLIDATVREIPKDIFDTWEGDTSIDATVVPVYGKRGVPWSRKDAKDAQRRGAIEFDAGWYLRTGRHQITDSHAAAKKSVFGYDVSVVAMTGHEPNDVPAHPLVVLGLGMTVPSAEVAESGVKVYTDIKERGYKTGRATGDRAYGPGTKEEKYQIPMRRLGYDLYMDYKDKQLGAKQGHYAGAVMVEGGFYCPKMPEDLVQATARLRAKEITLVEYRQLIERRVKYKLRAKEKPDAKGRVPMMCPARGPGATAECPIAQACGGGVVPKNADDDTLIPIYGEAPVDKHGAVLPICGNKTSVSFPIEAGAKNFQSGHYGSQEWQDIYSQDRSTIEGKNAFLKDGSKEALADPTRRRLRGYTAQFFLIALLYAAGNLRTLEKFRDEHLNPESAEELEDYFDKKLQQKMARKANAKNRVAAWDNFAEREAQEDAEIAAQPPDRT